MDYPIIKSKSKRPYQICNCCVMDTTDEDIVFDSKSRDIKRFQKEFKIQFTDKESGFVVYEH